MTASTQRQARDCGDQSVAAGRASTQLGWYAFAAGYVHGKSVLDVGCGLGEGLEILEQHAAVARGQDLDPRLAAPNILVGDVAELDDKSYDVLVSIDVIEHVEHPAEFLAQLTRVAREGFFLSTPNWTASRCQWPYHLREYTPREFETLLQPFGRVQLLKGSCSGSEVYPVRNRVTYHALNALRVWLPTAFLTRCLNRLLPAAFKIHSSNAAWVSVSGT